MFTNNLFGIELYGTMNDEGQVKEIIGENKRLLGELELNDFLKNKFDELVEQYGK